MNLATVVEAGSPVLRSVAQEVPVEHIVTPEFQALVAKMIETMRKAPGVGLSAPQIGVPLRVLVYEDNEALMGQLQPAVRTEQERQPITLRVLVNPILAPTSSVRKLFFEGCLSVSGFTALVERWHEIDVRGFDENGRPLQWRARGWEARILQHEVDHLDGKLFVDSMVPKSFGTKRQNGARFGSLLMADVQRELRL